MTKYLILTLTLLTFFKSDSMQNRALRYQRLSKEAPKPGRSPYTKTLDSASLEVQRQMEELERLDRERRESEHR